MITIQLTQTQMFLISGYFCIMFIASAYIENKKYTDFIGVIMLLCNGSIALLIFVEALILVQKW